MQGGWETQVDGAQRVYEFVIRADQVTGIYCTDCRNAETPAFINGKLAADGISFVVTHVRDDGSTAYRDHLTGKLEKGQLVVSGRSGGPNGGTFTWTLRKDPRGPAAGPPKGFKMPPMPPYEQPGPWEQLTPAKVVGVWFMGAGINKQYFIIRKVGNRLLGMVCGRCDNPYTMAALDDFSIQGNTLKFNITHEDWGSGQLPFDNHVTAHIARNEMHFIAVQDNGVHARRRGRIRRQRHGGRLPRRGDGGPAVRARFRAPGDRGLLLRLPSIDAGGRFHEAAACSDARRDFPRSNLHPGGLHGKSSRRSLHGQRGT
ncbi:MAG TPA: hypothetical protein VHX52_12105 [Steroidobacteraceae bacterium]|nr:hypothetical protein [Steroidobacteraceae bacterium]